MLRHRNVYLAGFTLIIVCSGKNERFCPILKGENNNPYEKYLEVAKEKYPGMIFLGRLGDYKYYDIDEAVARAMVVCKESS